MFVLPRREGGFLDRRRKELYDLTRLRRADAVFFNLAGIVQEPDDEGHELATLSDARIEASRFAGEYLRDRPEVAWLGDEFRIEVTDKDGRLLFTFIAIGVDAPAES